ncbi:MAG TPA: DUF2950 family protein [Gemmatimonadales bacterium]|nr:DUF2950 family protein [Gemmatimonadales bacterium]
MSRAMMLILTTVGLATRSVGQQPVQKTFASPAQAAAALFQAAEQRDSALAQAVLGPTWRELVLSGDSVQDAKDIDQFVRNYKEMHRTARNSNGTVTLYVGAENWPLPIPLAERNGAWFFDADAGKKEILFRRVGENELAAIAICRQLAEGAAADTAERYGYHFRLVQQGTTRAAIGYPAEYGSSGVMTFYANTDSTVYQKDLGQNTTGIAPTLGAQHPDKSWQRVNEK